MQILIFIKYTFGLITKSKVVLNSFLTAKGLFFIPLIIMTANTIDFKSLIYLLLSLMFFDFVTGIGASYFDKKNELKNLNHQDKEAEFQKLKKQSLISSEKLKMSGVKFALYGATILIAYYIQHIFMFKTISFDFTELKFSITTILISFWCAVEFYSIVFENFKRMGVDIVAMVLSVFKRFNGVKKEIEL